MEIKEAQEKVDESIKRWGGYWEHLSMMARMTEEVGELARAMNIKYGGKKSKFEGDGREIEEELSDVFLTVLAIANKEGIDLSEEFISKINKSDESYSKVYGEK